MFHHYIDAALNFAQSGSAALTDYLYIVVFLVALLESTPVIGTFTPGTLFFLFFGYSISVTDSNLAICVLIASIGAVLGDIIGYILGKYGGEWMIRHKKLLKQVHIEQGRGFFSRHGGKSIWLGRFVGPIRPIVPLVAGSIRMKFQRFLFWNISGAVVWCALYMTIGYFFGSHARIIEKVVTDSSWAVLILLAIAGLFMYRKYKKKTKFKHAQ